MPASKSQNTPDMQTFPRMSHATCRWTSFRLGDKSTLAIPSQNMRTGPVTRTRSTCIDRTQWFMPTRALDWVLLIVERVAMNTQRVLVSNGSPARALETIDFPEGRTRHGGFELHRQAHAISATTHFELQPGIGQNPSHQWALDLPLLREEDEVEGGCATVWLDAPMRRLNEINECLGRGGTHRLRDPRALNLRAL